MQKCDIHVKGVPHVENPGDRTLLNTLGIYQIGQVSPPTLVHQLDIGNTLHCFNLAPVIRQSLDSS